MKLDNRSRFVAGYVFYYQHENPSHQPGGLFMLYARLFSYKVHTLYHLKRFRGTKRLRKPIWCNLKRLFGTKSCQAGGRGYDYQPFCPELG